MGLMCRSLHLKGYIGGLAYRFVPEHIKTIEFFERYLLESAQHSRFSHIDFDLPESIAQETYLKAVRQNAEVLAIVPERYKTYELCMEAVRNFGFAIQDVPPHLVTKELALEAVKNHCHAIECIPVFLRSEEIYLEAIKTDESGSVWHYVPKEYHTKENFLIALSNLNAYCDLILNYMDSSLKTGDFFLEAVKLNGAMLKYIPEQFRTKELMFAAVQQDGSALRFLDASKLTQEEYKEACRIAFETAINHTQ